MSKKYQLQNSKTGEDIYPITSIECVQGLEEELNNIKAITHPCTKEEYDNIQEKNPNTIYLIKES